MFFVVKKKWQNHSESLHRKCKSEPPILFRWQSKSRFCERCLKIFDEVEILNALIVNCLRFSKVRCTVRVLALVLSTGVHSSNTIANQEKLRFCELSLSSLLVNESWYLVTQTFSTLCKESTQDVDNKIITNIKNL